MIRTAVLVFALATGAALSLQAAPASAGSPYNREPARDDPRHDPDASGVPGIPNLQGCVRLCERDQSPCDPPVYKRADGRCNYMD